MLWASLLIFSIACTEAALHGNTGLPVCVINCDMWYQASAPTTSPTETVGPFPLCHIIFDIWGYLIPCLASTGEVSSCSIAIFVSLFPDDWTNSLKNLLSLCFYFCDIEGFVIHKHCFPFIWIFVLSTKLLFLHRVSVSVANSFC